METRRLTPTLGVEVRGIDLSQPISDQNFEELHQLWLAHHGLMVVRGQDLTPEQQIAFSRNFGPLFGEADHFQESVHRYLHPDYPAIYRVSNKVKEGQPQGRAKAGNYWHSDVSFRSQPASASLLHAIEVPSVGGDTLFADMIAAYDGLSEGFRSMLEKLEAVHDFQTAARSSGTYDASQLTARDFDGANRTIHPVVITHPESGHRALFVNPGFTAGLAGFAEIEGKAILDYLYAWATGSRFVYRHRWEVGDLVIWDNRSLMHYAIVDYDEDRYLHRTTVLGGHPQR